MNNIDKSNEVTVNGFGIFRICRLCMKIGVYKKDLLSFKAQSSIAKMIKECTSILVTSYDEMPNYVCRLCFNQLVRTRRFQKRSLKSDKIIRSYLQKLRGTQKQIGIENNVQQFRSNHSFESFKENEVLQLNINVSPEYLLGDMSHAENFQPNDEQNHYGSYKLTERSLESNDSTDEHQDNIFVSTDNVDLEQIEELPGNNNFIVPEEIESEVDFNFDGNHFLSCNNVDDDEMNMYTDESVDENPLEQNDALENSKNTPEYYGEYLYPGENEHLAQQNIFGNHERRHKCDVCEKDFLTQRSLYRHKHVHKTEKPYQCEVCKKCFKQMRYLRKHQRNPEVHKLIHFRERPFPCFLCNKSFTQESDLQKHKVIHTDEKPYQCEVCKKHFKLKRYLRRHQRNPDVHKDLLVHDQDLVEQDMRTDKQDIPTEEQPFICDVCNKGFALESDLENHKSVHLIVELFQCEYCEERFRRANHLKKHMKTHRTLNTCDVCEMVFKYRKSFEKHKMAHAREGK